MAARRRAVVAASLLLGGCGRIGFDETTTSSPVRSTLHLDRIPPAMPLDDFPLPVTLDATRADLDRLDPTTLRFLTLGGTPLPHEVETVGPPLVAWVKVPRIEGLTTELVVEYGGATTTESPVFGSDYAGVWHMNGAGAVVDDASQGERDGDATSTLSTAGVIGDARDFANVGCVVVRGYENVAFPLPLTVSLWMWARTAHTSGDFDGALTQQSVGSSDLVFVGTDGPTLFGGVATMPAGTPTLFGPTQDVAVWQRLAYVLDGSQAILYVDGAAVANAAANGVPRAGPNPLFFGCGRNIDTSPIDQADEDYLDGLLDEIRIEAVARSPAWLAYEAAAHRDQVIRYGPPD